MRYLSNDVMKVVKRKAKSLGLTQTNLAKRLKVSLPTLKRWLAGGAISLDSLSLLVNEVGMTMTEVFSSVEALTTMSFQYSEEQEKFFSDHPQYLAYFDNLLRGLTPKQIQRKFVIDDRKTVSYLSKLDKLNLIMWLPNNEVRLLVEGEPVWNPKGPLARQLRKDIFESFIKSEKSKDVHFYLHDYSKEDREEILKKISELIEIAKQANRRARYHAEEAKPAGLYISFQDFRWNLDEYLRQN